MNSPQQTKTITIKYFAVLREQTDRSSESVHTTVQTPEELFRKISQKYELYLPTESMKIAINDEFSSWTARLHDGDTVAYIPPVAGG